MKKIIKDIYLNGIVPVIKLENPEKAVPLIKALNKGGIYLCEITFRSKAAGGAIKSIAANFPDALLGAGTVTNVSQVDEAIAAGAKFIVSPGFNSKIVEYCLDRNILIIPGVCTPSEIEAAIEMGLEVVKFFPAEQMGGTAFLKSVYGPYQKLRFLPTGGIVLSNLNDYLNLPNVLACGGSWMVRSELINKGSFEEITQIAKEAVNHMLGFKVAHIGINTLDSTEANTITRTICDLFGLEAHIGDASNFAGTGIEVLKSKYLGNHGHIAIQTNNVDRAINHLIRYGAKFNEETRVTDDNGRTKTIYLEEEIGGFAFHLLQK